MLENFQGDSWGSIPPLRMPSLLPHDLCHGRSSLPRSSLPWIRSQMTFYLMDFSVLSRFFIVKIHYFVIKANNKCYFKKKVALLKAEMKTLEGVNRSTHRAWVLTSWLWCTSADTAWHRHGFAATLHSAFVFRRFLLIASKAFHKHYC